LFYLCFGYLYFSTTLDARRLTPEEAAAPYPVTAPFTTTDGVAGGGLVPHAHFGRCPSLAIPRGGYEVYKKTAAWFLVYWSTIS